MTFENLKDFPPTSVCEVCFVFPLLLHSRVQGLHDGCQPSGLWRSHEETLVNLHSWHNDWHLLHPAMQSLCGTERFLFSLKNNVLWESLQKEGLWYLPNSISLVVSFFIVYTDERYDPEPKSKWDEEWDKNKSAFPFSDKLGELSDKIGSTIDDTISKFRRKDREDSPERCRCAAFPATYWRAAGLCSCLVCFCRFRDVDIIWSSAFGF